MSCRIHSSCVAVLPALNESQTIKLVVTSLLPFLDVLVVDDGSSDSTSCIAQNAGAFIINHDKNQGYDRALESGLAWAKTHGYKYAITLDSDGQHSASSVPTFVNHLESGVDIVVGVRLHMQRWSEYLFSLIASVLWNIRDPLCGMKGYKLELLDKVICFDSYSSIGTELTIRAARSGCCIKQVPVAVKPRIDASRFGVSFVANFRILRAIVFGLFFTKPF